MGGAKCSPLRVALIVIAALSAIALLAGIFSILSWQKVITPLGGFGKIGLVGGTLMIVAGTFALGVSIVALTSLPTWQGSESPELPVRSLAERRSVKPSAKPRQVSQPSLKGSQFGREEKMVSPSVERPNPAINQNTGDCHFGLGRPILSQLSAKAIDAMSVGQIRTYTGSHLNELVLSLRLHERMIRLRDLSDEQLGDFSFRLSNLRREEFLFIYDRLPLSRKREVDRLIASATAIFRED